MLCGSSYVDLENFLEFASNGFYLTGDYIPRGSLPASQIPGNLTLTDLAWEECWTIKQGRASIFGNDARCINMAAIPQLLHNLRARKVQEEVDRIWAISALLKQDVQQKLAPLVDYSEEGRSKYYETHARAVKVLIEDSKSLSMFYISPSVEANEALPSWCPDLCSQGACLMKLIGWWNYSANAPDQPHRMALTAEDDTNACISRRETIQLQLQKFISFADDDKLLCVRGFVADEISEVVEDTLLLGKISYTNGDWSDISLNNPTHTAAISFYTRALELARRTFSSKNDPVGDNIPAEYLMAFRTDCRINAQQEMAYRDALSIFMSCNPAVCLEMEIGRQQNMLECIRNMKAVVGHSFFATKGGRFGLAQPGCKVGDKVCVFYGEEPLHILRWPEERTAGNRGHAKLCGVVFIPHLMEPHQSDAARLSEDEIFEIA